MTRKLYYEDAHIRAFDAAVVSCGERDGAFEAIRRTRGRWETPASSTP